MYLQQEQASQGQKPAVSCHDQSRHCSRCLIKHYGCWTPIQSCFLSSKGVGGRACAPQRRQGVGGSWKVFIWWHVTCMSVEWSVCHGRRGQCMTYTAMRWCCLPLICSSSSGHIPAGVLRCVSMLHAVLFCHHLGCLTTFCSLVLLSFLTAQRKGDFNFCWFDWMPVELLPKEESAVIFVWTEIFLSLLRDACSHHPHQITA